MLFDFFFLLILKSVCRNVALIKSSKDTRYAIDAVVTHDGVKFPCWPMPDLFSFQEKFGADLYDKVMQIIRLFLVIHLSQLSACFGFFEFEIG